MPTYYFAYGSNMNPARMQARKVPFDQAESGWLPDFELCFNKRAADRPGISYANIRVRRGAVVEGVLYRLPQPADIARLDPFEGTPRLYSRELFVIHTARGPQSAWVYIANRAMIQNDLYPARWYLEHLLAGAPYLSADYLAQLRQVTCAE